VVGGALVQRYVRLTAPGGDGRPRGPRSETSSGPITERETGRRSNASLSDTVCFVIVHQTGLTVAEVTGLRRQMRGAGASFKVTKNRLARLALKGTKFEQLSPMFTARRNCLFADPVAAAKVAVEFANKNDKLAIWAVPSAASSSTQRGEDPSPHAFAR